MIALRLLLISAMLPLCGAAMAAPPRPDAADLALFDRVTWGASESGVAKLRAMGPERWLQWQLHPTQADTLPPVAQAQIDAMTISRTPMMALVQDLAAQGKAANQIVDPTQKQAARQTLDQTINGLAREAAARDVLRDLYSPTQLRERMTWFWFNHFNVHQYKADIRETLPDYEDAAIRANALGNFGALLLATSRHPAMLRYLDNAANAGGHINENYAREIMELHSMGVGSGYTQKDVEELARIFTGVGIDDRAEDPKLKPELQGQLIRDGLFEFNPARHDYGDKVFLGHAIKGRGYAEVEEAIAILASEPATAHHISQELATYFLGDQPPEALVQRMAQAFTQSGGDIPSVLLTMFHSPEFSTLGAAKFKDPVRYTLSAVRLAYGDRVILNTQPIQGWLNRMGEGLFNHDTPDGYSLLSTAWNGPGQLAVRFEIARQIGYGASGMFKPPVDGGVDHPGFPQLENALFFSDTRHALTQATLAALDQAISPQEWNQLFLSSPEFMN